MNINELIKKRRTIRKFRQTKIEEEKLLSYIDAARLAPSGANLQPLKYIIINDEKMVEEVFNHVKWAGYLAPDYNPQKGEEPTAYIVILSDTDICANSHDMDVGAATQNIILSALCDGIGACWMGAIDREAISSLLKLPENLKVSCVVALGYPAEQPREVLGGKLIGLCLPAVLIAKDRLLPL